MILNLKTFNGFLKFNHDKLESVKDEPDLITESCYFGTVELKDASYTTLFMKITKNIWNCSGRKNTINILSLPMDFHQL